MLDTGIRFSCGEVEVGGRLWGWILDLKSWPVDLRDFR